HVPVGLQKLPGEDGYAVPQQDEQPLPEETEGPLMYEPARGEPRDQQGDDRAHNELLGGERAGQQYPEEIAHDKRGDNRGYGRLFRGFQCATPPFMSVDSYSTSNESI